MFSTYAEFPLPPRADAQSQMRRRNWLGGKTAFSFLAFVLGLLLGQKLVIFGEIYVGELLAPIYLVVVVSNYRLSRTERILTMLSAIWCAAQVISDFYNHTPLLSAVKGTLAPAVFITTFLAATIYFRRSEKRLPSFLLGSVLGGLANQFIAPHFFVSENSAFFADNMWKWGVGPSILVVFSIWYSFFLRTRSLALLIVFLVVFAIPSLYFQGRGLAVFPLLAAGLYSVFRSPLGPKLQATMRGSGANLKFGLLTIILVLAINQAATWAFSSDLVLAHLNADDADKYRSQAGGNFGVLLGGRSESLVSIKAFLDSPILGHGSWAQDYTGNYTYDYLERVRNLNYSPGSEESIIQGITLIPTHSFLFGALVWGGAIAGILWVYTLGIVWSRFLFYATLLPFYFVNGTLNILWNILFSPFAADTRWDSAIYLAGFLIFVESQPSVESRFLKPFYRPDRTPPAFGR